MSTYLEPNRSATKAPLVATKVPLVAAESLMYGLSVFLAKAPCLYGGVVAFIAFGVIWFTLFQGSFAYNFLQACF